MRKNNKWLLRVTFTTFIVSFALLLIKIPSYAANEIITAKTHIDVLVAPEEGADVMVSFEKGEPLFVTGIKDGWYCVLFRGETGYFSTTASLNAGADLDGEDAMVDDDVIADIISNDDIFEEVLASEVVETIDDEFEKGAELSQFIEQETTTRNRAKRNAVIWGIVIVVLVCAIFVLGIIGTKKENAKKKKKTSSKKNVLDVIDLDAEE